MSDDSDDLPIVIPVPIPCFIPRARGIYATTGDNGCLIQYRGTRAEQERFHKAAEKCGVNYSQYLRWINNKFTDYILKESSGYDNGNGTGPDPD